MEKDTLEEGTRVAMVAGWPNDSEIVKDLEQDTGSNVSVALRHWVKVWMCYMGVLDAFLSVAIYLSMMPQYVTLPYVASAEQATIPAVLLQVVGYPLLMTLVAGKAQVLLMLVFEVAQHFDENYILELCTHLLMMTLNLNEVNRSKVVTFLRIGFGVGFAISVAYGVHLEFSGENFGLISGILVVCCHMTTIFAYFHYVAMIAHSCRGEHRLYEVPPQQAVQRATTMRHMVSEPSSRQNMEKGYGYMVTVLVGLIAVALLVRFQIIDKSFLILSTALGAVLYALAFSHFFPSVLQRRCYFFPCTNCFWIVIWLLVFFAVIFSFLPSMMGGVGDNHLTHSIFKPGKAFNSTYIGPGQLSGFGAYPVCNGMSWMTRNMDGTEFQALDLLVFAQAMYHNSNENILAEIGNATYNTELWPVEIEEVQEVQEVARVGVFTLPSTKTRVVSVRGTSQAADWLLNADIWAPSALLSMVKYMMPLGSLFPLSFSRYALAPDIRELLGLPPPWESVRERIAEAKAKSDQDGYGLLLTGHSLGGGIAQLIGSVEGIRTLTFSPVGQGITQSRVTGGVHKRYMPIANTAVSVIPSGDVVPKIDVQLGVAQRIACTAVNPITCHSLWQTACELYRKCGDPRNRSIDATCKIQVGDDWRTIPWERFVWYD